MSGNVRRRELIEPVFVPGSLELPFLDPDIQDKTCDTVDQRSNDSHLGYDRRTAKGSDRGFAKNGNIFFERALVLSAADRKACNSRYRSVPLGISKIRRGCWAIKT